MEPAGKTPDISEPKPEEILVDKAPVMTEKAEEGSWIFGLFLTKYHVNSQEKKFRSKCFCI